MRDYSTTEHDTGRFERFRTDEPDDYLRPTRAEAEADERYLRGES